MAYTISQVQDWNESLRSRRLKLVALFVGGTSGIGKHAAIRLANVVDQPTIYLVGRNAEAGARIVEELKAGNPNGSYCFIPADVSRLSDVDALCQQLQVREKSLDLLFLSAGALAFSKQVRLLEAAGKPRVISVLGGGREVSIEDDNLDLRKRFSFSASIGYPATMTSLAFEVLASQHPSISFIHEFPGVVATPILKKSMGGVLGTIVSLLLRPISISEQESGEWQVFLSTSPSFPAKGSAGPDAATERGIKITQASTGEVGGGFYILKYNGQDVTNKSLMAQLREKGFLDIVWKHTLDTFDRILA
ncbi:hypothetical protein CNMCM5623_009445 [Aspergillus felis]|uniref:NAD(P)-binding protein n=1 Tax=Aspergillus felis TaxID=1287682 RepID=A0A8H6UUY6_9EURO|nr:hypothetical protein CNMCM5623_009445 [Aspergillus felis]KAF7181241.1 hypothetical protein CNMCM7691_000459 [Aspergillus felis]